MHTQFNNLWMLFMQKSLNNLIQLIINGQVILFVKQEQDRF